MSDPGKSPRTDAEWARDIQRRVDESDHPTTSRIGDWVLAVDESGALRASRSDGYETVLAAPPDPDATTPVVTVPDIEVMTARRADVNLGQWNTDDLVTLPSFDIASGRIYCSAFDPLPRGGRLTSLRWFYSGDRGMDMYRVGLYQLDPVSLMLTRLWVSDEVKDQFFTNGPWGEAEVMVTYDPPVEAGARLFFAHHENFGNGQRYVGCAPRSVARPTSFPLYERFELFSSTGQPGSLTPTLDLTTMNTMTSRRIWASVTLST